MLIDPLGRYATSRNGEGFATSNRLSWVPLSRVAKPPSFATRFCQQRGIKSVEGGEPEVEGTWRAGDVSPLMTRRAGALLTDIITKGMGLARERVYIANVLKCRPPDNRDPTPEEKTLCTPWLDRQIELVNPAVLIPLGRHAAGHVLKTDSSLGRLRGRVHTALGRKVVPTYHPSYLLRNPADKKACWQDIQIAMAELGLAGPRSAPGSQAPR